MPKRTFSKDAIYRACENGENDTFKRIHVGDWIDKGKYSYRTIILQAKDDNKFYNASESREGSPFTDYNYSWDWEPREMELDEVHEVEKVIKAWEAVK